MLLTLGTSGQYPVGALPQMRNSGHLRNFAPAYLRVCMGQYWQWQATGNGHLKTPPFCSGLHSATCAQCLHHCCSCAASQRGMPTLVMRCVAHTAIHMQAWGTQEAPVTHT